MKIFGNSDFYLCTETIDRKNVEYEIGNQFINNLDWYGASISYNWSCSTTSSGMSWADYNILLQPYFNKGSIYKECKGWLNGMGKSISIDSEEAKKCFIKLDIEVDDEMRKIDEKLALFDIPFTITPTKCLYDEESKEIMNIVYCCSVYPPIYLRGLLTKRFDTTDLKLAMKMVWRCMRSFSKTSAILSSCIKGNYYHDIKTLNIYKIKEKLPF